MNFELKEISAAQLQEFYDQFDGPKTFLQTQNFGAFRSQLGEKNFRLGLFVGETLKGISQCQKITARRGTFLHVAHGPLLREENKGLLLLFLEEIKVFGRQEKCDFVRISPLLNPLSIQEFKKVKYRTAPLHINPNRTWVLDLTRSEEDLLKNMRKSTRYEVRRIEKCGIKTIQGQDLETFWKLHSKTAARQKFVPFSRKSTKLELDIFKNDCQIFSASLEGKDFASSVILYDKHAGYYHQGASVLHKLPFAHATLWAAITEAKKRGCTEFNFWGVSPEENKDHPWTGLSRFKRGFGGEEQLFLEAQDFPLTKKYWINFAVEKYRKWKRHY
jgi:lipid II:glycine glycyltransferase (peptidoglycan interpeptide bridge formation enzyme)